MDEKDYDYNGWNDFVLRNCEWDDGKNGEGEADGRTNTKDVGVRGEMAPNTGVGAKSMDKSSRKGSGSAGKKQRTSNEKSTSSFKDYIDDGRDYI